MKKYALIVIPVLLLTSSILQAQDRILPGQYNGQITVDDMSRSFIVYLPKSYTGTKKLPVIFLFHGGGATAGSMMNISNGDDFKSISEKKNVILIAPEGIEKSWNDGRQTKSNKLNVDDVKFINQLILYAVSKYAIDTTKMYATGISNGGFMVSRLGCEIGYRFAAIAVVAATMGEEVPYSTCAPDFTLPVMYIHGTADPIIPFNGAEKSLGAEGAFVSHQKVIDKWIAINKCSTVPSTLQLPDLAAMDQTTVTRRDYVGRGNGVRVVSLVINNGGHTWPGGRQYLPKLLVGRVCRDINACEKIWDFFNEFRR